MEEAGSSNLPKPIQFLAPITFEWRVYDDVRRDLNERTPSDSEAFA